MKIDEQTVAYSKDGIHLEIGQKYGAIDNPHSHDDEYQIELILKGRSQNIADQRCGDVTPGYIDIYNPSDMHQTNYLHTDSFIFHVQLNALKKIYNEMNIFKREPIFNPMVSKKSNIPLAFLTHELQILKELQVVPSSNMIEMYKEQKVLALLKLMLRDVEVSNVDRHLRTIDYYSRQKMLKIKEWIHANFHRDDITIRTLAEMSHLSRFHFIRVFNEVLGKSPYDYLIEVRVNAALSMLKGRKYRNIDEVSLVVGFRNTSQLRYHFKRLKGYLPSQVL